MDSGPPVLSILIVNWNTRTLLLDCLQSLASAAPGVSHEVLVVDNASGDGSADAVRAAFPDVTLMANDANVGFAAANNQALAASTGRFVLLLNSDTRVPPGSLDALVAFLDATPRAGIVGPQLLNADGSFQISALRFTEPRDLYHEFARFPRAWQPAAQRAPRRLIPLHREAATPVDYVMGAALLIRRETVDQIGPMDDGFFMYAEEVDWCFRAKAAGWGVWYLPTAEIVHLGGQSTAQVADRMVAQRFASTFRFFAKHQGRLAAWRARALLAGAALQNMALSIAWRLTGRDGAAGLADQLRLNRVVWRTAVTGRVPGDL